MDNHVIEYVHIGEFRLVDGRKVVVQYLPSGRGKASLSYGFYQSHERGPSSADILRPEGEAWDERSVKEYIRRWLKDHSS